MNFEFLEERRVDSNYIYILQGLSATPLSRACQNDLKLFTFRILRKRVPLIIVWKHTFHLYGYYAVLTSICTKLTCEAIKVGSEADMEPRTGNLILCN